MGSNPETTREAFILGYIDRSDIEGAEGFERTPGGFRLGTYELVAVPCDCGEDGCEGWAMVNKEDAADGK